MPKDRDRIDETEIATLAAQYGEPIRWSRILDVSKETFEAREGKNAERRGEIVLAMPRPGGRVLLHTKDFYPAGAFRLPTGGIDIGEPVVEAALREIGEETGLAARLERLFGVVEYEFRHAGESMPFVSYVFLTGETREKPHVTDASERITEFREVEWQALLGIAEGLERLPGEWNDWGRFRAIPHRLVLEARAASRLRGQR